MTNTAGYVFIDDVIGDTLSITADFGADVSGSTWLAPQLRSDPESATILNTATVDTTAAASGLITWTFSAAQTAARDPGVYYTDLQRTNGGVVSTWPRVAIRLEQDVSRV